VCVCACEQCDARPGRPDGAAGRACKESVRVCISISSCLSHIGRVSICFESSCGACRGRALFCAKINRRSRRISGFSPRPVMTSKSPFAKLGIKLPSPGTRLRSVRWRSVSSGRSCQDRATVHYSPCRWYVLDVITSAAAARNFARSCNTQERLAGVPPSWSAAAAVSQASRTTSRDLRVSSHE